MMWLILDLKYIGRKYSVACNCIKIIIVELISICSLIWQLNVYCHTSQKIIFFSAPKNKLLQCFPFMRLLGAIYLSAASAPIRLSHIKSDWMVFRLSALSSASIEHLQFEFLLITIKDYVWCDNINRFFMSWILWRWTLVCIYLYIFVLLNKVHI